MKLRKKLAKFMSTDIAESDTLDQQPQIRDGKSSRLFRGLGNDD